MAVLTGINKSWTNKPPQDEKALVDFVQYEGLPIWRQMLALLNLLLKLLTVVTGGNAIIAIFANVAAGRLYTGDSVVALVQGALSAFDGGEGAFAKNLTDVTTADDGVTCFIDADGHRWIRF